MWAFRGHTEHCLQENVNGAFKSHTVIFKKSTLRQYSELLCIWIKSFQRSLRKKYFLWANTIHCLPLLIGKTYSIEIYYYLLGKSFLKYSFKNLYYSFLYFLNTLLHIFGYGQYHPLLFSVELVLHLNLLRCTNETASYREMTMATTTDLGSMRNHLQNEKLNIVCLLVCIFWKKGMLNTLLLSY